jgi:hypothetical protein
MLKGTCCWKICQEKAGPKLTPPEMARARRHLRRAQHSTIASATRLINSTRSPDDQVSTTTVRNRVAKGVGSGLHYGNVVRKRVSGVNAQKRKKATTRAQICKVKEDINRLVFLDASYVRWRKGEPIKAFRIGDKAWVDERYPREQNLKACKTFQFYSALTKGPDGAVHRHPLIFVPAGGGLTAAVFVKQVATPVLKWANNIFEEPGFEFVQDNASCHTASETQSWMELHDYCLYKHPAQSPDLNRIEKAWAYFKTELLKKRPRTEKGFYKAMHEVWQGLQASTLARFIDELPNVMAEVHQKPLKQVHH